MLRAAGAGSIPSVTLINTAKLNDVDPQTWLADVRAHRRHGAGPAPVARIAAAEFKDPLSSESGVSPVGITG